MFSCMQNHLGNGGKEDDGSGKELILVTLHSMVGFCVSCCSGCGENILFDLTVVVDVDDDAVDRRWN